MMIKMFLNPLPLTAKCHFLLVLLLVVSGNGLTVKRSMTDQLITDSSDEQLTSEIFARYQYAVLYREGFLKIHIDGITKSFNEIENTDIILSSKLNETTKYMSTEFKSLNDPNVTRQSTIRLSNGSTLYKSDFGKERLSDEADIHRILEEQKDFQSVTKQSGIIGTIETDEDEDLFRRIKYDLAQMENTLRSKMLIEGKLIRFFKIDGSCVKVEYMPDAIERFKYSLRCSRLPCKLIPRTIKREILEDEILDESEEWKSTVLTRRKRSETSDDDSFDVISRIIKNTTLASVDDSNIVKAVRKTGEISRLSNFLHWNKFCKGSDNKAVMRKHPCVSLEISYNVRNQCLRIPHCRSDISTFDKDGTSCISEKPSVCPSSLTMMHKIMDCSTNKEMQPENLNNIRQEIELNYCLITLLDSGEIAGRRCGEGMRVTVHLSVYLIKGQDSAFYTLPIPIRKIHNPKLIEAYNCSAACKEGHCRGDSIYLENFRGGEESEYCSFNKDYFHYSLFYKEKNYPISCWMEMKVKAELLSDDIPDESILMDKVSFSCSNGFLDYNTQGVNIAMVSICSNRTCAHKQNLNGEGSLRMPNSFFIVGTTIKILAHLPQHRGSKTFVSSCLQAEICDINPCFFCLERWISYHCFGLIEWLVYLTIMMTILIMFMFSLRGLILITLITCKTLNPLRVFCFWTCYKCKNKVRSGTIYTKNAIDQMNIEMEDQQPLISDTNQPKKTKKNKYVSRTFILNIVVILFIPVVLGFDSCEHHASITINQNDCPEGICSISDSSRVVLASKGATSCFRFEEANKIVAESVQIRTVSVGLSCDAEVLYHHPKVTVQCKSRHNCKSVDLCTDNKCEEIKNDDTIKGFEDQQHQAGMSGCDKVCGCAGCGCFYCTQSCLFYRAYFLNLERKSYEIRKCVKWTYFSDIEVTIVSIKETRSESARLIPGATIKVLGIDLTLVSLTNIPSNLDSECFMVFNGKASLTGCNERGKVTKGQIGEIQCPSHDVSLTAGSSCNFEPSLVSVRTTSDSAKCDAFLINPEKVFKEKPLPFLFADGLLRFESGRLIHEIREDFSLELQLDFHNHGVSVIYDKSMCYIDFIKLEGCYNCVEGSIMVIKGKTNHGGSIANINCPSLKTPITESLTKDQVELRIHSNFAKSSVNELCSVTCSGGNTTFRLRGDLIYVPATPLSSDSSFIDYDHHSSSFDVWSLFQSNWFITIISILGVLLMILMLVFFAKMLFKAKRV